MANKTYNDHPTDNTPAADDLIPYWDVASSAAKKATRAKIVGATITGDGAIDTGGKTLTVPATGTAALRDVENTFTANQSISGTLVVTGDVGIGGAPVTTSAGKTLNVQGGIQATNHIWGQGRLYVMGVGDTPWDVNLEAIYLDHSGGTANIRVISAGSGVDRNLAFALGGSERVRFTTNGSVGIGTPSPSYKLDVSGDINASGSVRSNGTPLTSDGTLKDAPTPTKSALSKLAAVRGYEFTWSDKARQMGLPEGTQHGLIAQEVEQIFPDLVSEWEVETGEYVEGENGEQTPMKERIKCVDYARMVPILLEAVRELAGRVDALTSAAKA